MLKELAQAMFRKHADDRLDHDAKTVHRCPVSERVVRYPETLYGAVSAAPYAGGVTSIANLECRPTTLLAAVTGVPPPSSPLAPSV